MKLVFAVLVSTMCLAASDPQAKKQQPAPAKTIKPIEIPAGAVEREPGRYYYTDSQGKKWVYSKTPFGVARAEDKPADPNEPPPLDPLADVKITEVGDTVKFERPGPFGTYRWEKKRSDLDEKEQAAVQKAHEKAAKQDK